MMHRMPVHTATPPPTGRSEATSWLAVALGVTAVVTAVAATVLLTSGSRAAGTVVPLMALAPGSGLAALLAAAAASWRAAQAGGRGPVLRIRVAIGCGVIGLASILVFIGAILRAVPST